MKTILAILGIIFLIYLAVKLEIINPKVINNAKAQIHQVTSDAGTNTGK